MKPLDVAVGVCPDCGKVRYPTRKSARRGAYRGAGTVGKAMHAYRCGDYWHLTSRPAVVIAAYRDWRAGR